MATVNYWSWDIYQHKYISAREIYRYELQLIYNAQKYLYPNNLG